jgi:hypothetical protein
MNRTWFPTAGILTGLCLAVPALPQAYTISAKPGVVNYLEGNTSLNGQPVSPGELRSTALNAGDVLSTEVGKAEVLLTPGVFLRLGSNTEVHMISPSLIDTQLELRRGEAMIEVDQIVKDCRISVLNHGASILIDKSGLYRFSADDAPRVAVIDGRAQVYLGDKKVDLGKGKEVVLSDLLKPEKFDRKKEDELYAWSNVRSEYNASMSYQAARAAPANGYGYGYAGGGWMWNAGFNSWAWLPGDGAFFSPFGWGFFAPGAVAYAPVIAIPVGGRGRWQGRGRGDHDHDGDRHHRHPGGGVTASSGAPTRPGPSALVPVNPNSPPAMGFTSSPWADHMARRQAQHAAWAAGGFRTSSGAPSPGFNARGFNASQPSAGGGGGHRAWSGSRPAGSPGGSGGWHGGGGGMHNGGGGGMHTGGGGGGGMHSGGGGGGGGGHASAPGGAGGTHGR